MTLGIELALEPMIASKVFKYAGSWESILGIQGEWALNIRGKWSRWTGSA